MNCIICDDDEKITIQIRDYVNLYARLNSISIDCETITNPCELLSRVGIKSFNLYLLDIVMPTMSGIELAKKIRQKDNNCVIIFLTSSTEYAKDAFEVDALQYLDKPVDKIKFNQTLDRAIKYLHIDKQNLLPIISKSGVHAVNINDIVYIESNRHTLYLYLTTGEMIETKDSAHTISKIAEQLPFPPFITPYKGYIVNMSHISHIKKYCFCTASGVDIPIPTRQFNSIKEQYTNFILNLVSPEN